MLLRAFEERTSWKATFVVSESKLTVKDSADGRFRKLKLEIRPGTAKIQRQAPRQRVLSESRVCWSRKMPESKLTVVAVAF